MYGTTTNSGDDHAGYVHKVGSKVTEFKPGDRVASYHVIFQPHGSYAEYAIGPAHTTFHIPESISFEEAVTIPLASMTAAVALYQELQLPLPWVPHVERRIPLIIYGGSTAVGAFALKFAKLSNIHPIITVAGSGVDYVKSLGIADHVIDYRKGNVLEEIKAALNGEKVYHALDAVSENGTYDTISKVLENPGGKLHVVLSNFEVPEGIIKTDTTVSSVHLGPALDGKGPEYLDFGHVMFRYIGRLLAEGRFSGHPHTVIEGGLNGVEKGLIMLKDGKASATKYVYRVAEN